MNPNRLKFRRAKSASATVAISEPVVIAEGLSEKNWHDLRRIAIVRGVYHVGMTRKDIEIALSK